ncbi:MAG: ATP-dependent RNA helicase DeaD [Candidatus Azotimanducaceae bacterium]|jgi:ATP-dependent RNA helicase DeaD
MTESKPNVQFSDLNLPPELMASLESVGYETPSPIQVQAIPVLLKGNDLLGHAPTGTGKTAAFALPLIARTKVEETHVQVMVLTPTRELALQVAEAFQTYAANVKGFHVLPIYGGQDYGPQLQRLRRGVHVVVGTPGRVRDHLQRGTLKLDKLSTIVLDEADEMLRMGFKDEVEWILQQTPNKRQVALFSATMPPAIKSIAKRYMREPREISIKSKSATAETIRQRYWLVSGVRKLEALTRILEFEPIDGVLIFVRTKSATSELADRLEARGYAAAAMNGDMAQRAREQTVERLKRGTLDVLVATDVAARGLDVSRISHVINFDIPYDTEAYIHRIGRTGRAGRTGEAILFVAPREQRMLGAIEKATRQKIQQLQLPTTETVKNKRIADFKQRITDTLAAGDLQFMQTLVEQYQQEQNVPALDIAAALAHIAMGDAAGDAKDLHQSDRGPDGRRRDRNGPRDGGPLESRKKSRPPKSNQGSNRGSNQEPNQDIEVFRLEVGSEHGVEPSNIVGAIANEAGLGSDQIGRIEIELTHSTVELPRGMPKEIFRDLRKVWVCGRTLNISRASDAGKPESERSDQDRPVTEHVRKKDKAATKATSKAIKKKKKKKANKDKGKPHKGRRSE